MPVWAAGACPPEDANPVSGRTKPDPFLSGTVYRITGWRLWFLVWPASLLLRLYYATLRIRIDAKDEAALRNTSQPLVVVAWHNRSFIVPFIFRRFRRPGKCFCLISPSRAAAWEDAMFHLLGIPSARGSSSRRSIVAMRELLKGFHEGNDICISPDGPTGPRYEFKRGATVAARLTKAPILLLGAESECAWRPHTWDRHFVPLPFSRVTLRGRILNPAELFRGRDDEAASLELAKHLSAINDDHGQISGR